MTDHEHESGVTRGMLARVTGCNIETIRYYEKTGLLPNPPRTDAGYRIYFPAHFTRLRFILRARELGFSMEDIRGLIGLDDGTAPTCAEVKRRTERHLTDIRARIADLRRIERVLGKTAEKCTGAAVPDCPVLQSLSDRAV
ncbi:MULTISPECIES: MerR family transcriptional regulator [Nioella]|jgi:MerR family mercuric resistance operon transcriptional regulator|uniref:MerR family transcriptional regulator n=1 Tax=Nioella TaxID=1775424 RepID=UPI000FDB864C|nr:helix-turn-helix domain-containing protein [Nioella ostreopsis]